MIKRKSMHFIGIGGTGLSAIARVLLESGYQVTGSDRSLSPLAKSLKEEGVRVAIGHRAENIEGAQLVVRSSAVPDDNVEILAAHKLGIPVLKRSEFLSSLMDQRMGIAVAGTHGKSSTTAMIVHILIRAGLAPGYIIGADLPGVGNAAAGTSPYFVIDKIEFMCVLPASYQTPVLQWLSAIPYPWSSYSEARAGLPSIDALTPIAQFLRREAGN